MRRFRLADRRGHCARDRDLWRTVVDTAALQPFNDDDDDDDDDMNQLRIKQFVSTDQLLSQDCRLTQQIKRRHTVVQLCQQTDAVIL